MMTVRRIEQIYATGKVCSIRLQMETLVTSILENCIFYLDTESYTLQSINYTDTVQTVLHLSGGEYKEKIIREIEFHNCSVGPLGAHSMKFELTDILSISVRQLSPWAVLELALLKDTWLANINATTSIRGRPVRMGRYQDIYQQASPITQRYVVAVRDIGRTYRTRDISCIRGKMVDVMTSICTGCMFSLSSSPQNAYTMRSIEFSTTSGYEMKLRCLGDGQVYSVHERMFHECLLAPLSTSQTTFCLDEVFSSKVRLLSPWALLEMALLQNIFLTSNETRTPSPILSLNAPAPPPRRTLDIPWCGTSPSWLDIL